MAPMSKSDMALSKTFSARFLAVVLMTISGCYMAIRQIPIDPQFATLWGVVVTYYFGKSDKELVASKTTEVKTEVASGG